MRNNEKKRKEKQQERAPRVVDTSSLRNVGIKIAVNKPPVYLKVICGMLVTILNLLITYELVIIKPNYTGLVAVIITLVSFYFTSKFLDNYLLSILREEHLSDELPVIVMGYSNTLLLLLGEMLIDEVETDELEIVPIGMLDSLIYYENASKIIAKQDGLIIAEYFVEGVEDYEGCVLRADMSRTNEDIEIIRPEGDED